MARPAHRRAAPGTKHDAGSLLIKVEQEMAAGYLEVEITGISLRRLAAVYRVMFREVWGHTVDGVRSWLRPTPAL